MAATGAAKNRAIRQEALREQLANKGLIQKVLENSKKMEEQGEHMAPQALQGLKYATDVRLKLINKYLPDLKQVEATINEDGLYGMTEQELRDKINALRAELD